MSRDNFTERLGVCVVMLVSLLLMVPAFFAPHIENDEIIYKTLMAKTSFLLDGYTLRGSSILASLPAIYDTSLFFHPPMFFLVGKVLFLVAGESGLVGISTAASLGTTLLIYLIGRSLYGFKVGLVASILWALNPLQLFVAQRIWLDSLMTFFVILAVFLCITESKKRLLTTFLAGVVLLFGIMTKYPASLAIVPVVIAIVIQEFSKMRFLVTRLMIFILPLLALVPWFFYFHAHTGALFLFSKPTADMIQAFPCVRMVLQRPFYFFIVQSLLSYPIYVFAFLAVRKNSLKPDLVISSWVLVYFVFMTVFGLGGGGLTLRYILPAYPALSLLSAKYLIANAKNSLLLALVGCFMAVGLITAFINYGHAGAVDISNLFEGCYSGCSCV